MYAHILIATDGSEQSVKAVDQGVELAKALGAKVTAIHVTEPWTAAVSGEWAIAFPVEEYEKVASANAKTILQGVADRAAKAGVPCKTLHVRDQYPAEGIVEKAQEQRCDLIVMGSHGRRGLAKLILGSQANRVVAQSAVPVLVCR
jgi:nucleotide-binding universal stress UspA family protein